MEAGGGEKQVGTVDPPLELVLQANWQPSPAALIACPGLAV